MKIGLASIRGNNNDRFITKTRETDKSETRILNISEIEFRHLNLVRNDVRRCTSIFIFLSKLSGHGCGSGNARPAKLSKGKTRELWPFKNILPGQGGTFNFD